MSIFNKVRENLNAIFSDWIKVYDNENPLTIEDFLYNTSLKVVFLFSQMGN